MTKVNDNVQKLLEKRYFLKDNEGKLIEHTWSDVAMRVAKSISQAEDKGNRNLYQKKFYSKINDMEFIPSSPCIFNAGTPSQSLSSCFIVDIEDNIEGIFQTVAECAKIFQMSGGAGFSMRKIRPNGAKCKSSGSNASGVVSFMFIFNEVVNRVKQGNKRNGAIKIDLPCDHPEIFEFVHSKDDTNELNNMNISVSITTEFVEAVESNSDWDLKFKGKVYQTVKATDLWNEIMQCAHKTGEPGLSYQSNMDEGNMNPHINLEVFGNPCHEFVNVPYSSCNLASINLIKIVNKSNEINWIKLEENIRLTFRFLDDMITMNKLPLKKIEDMTKSLRPIGLGTMGFAQLLYTLKIPYDSQECLDFVDELYGFIDEKALEYNLELGSERGKYPAYKGSKWEEKNLEVRCSSMTSIAPNGSIAFIADTTGGIEPQFALVYKRRDNDNDEYMVADSIFENYLKENNLFTEEILNKINDNKGSIKGLDNIFTKETQGIFVTANDISAEWHVKVLAQIQKYISLSISKTVNLPNEATVEDVGNVYLMAAKNGIKGITVYRDGCRENQVLSTGGTKEETTSQQDFIFPSETLDYAHAERFKVNSGCGSFWLFLCYDDDGVLREIFSQSATSGGCNGMTEALSRMTSLALKSNIHPDVIIDQLKSVKCPVSMMMKKEKGLTSKSCADAIGNAIRDFIGNKELKTVGTEIHKIELHIPEVEIESNKCPSCGSDLGMTEGCRTCFGCGWSRCS